MSGQSIISNFCLFFIHRSYEGRLNTCANQFASENGLGDPIAGNIFQAQYDDYVPIVQAQLAGAN